MRTKYLFHASVAFVVFISSGAAFAATYNFYFNNTEQGNNSTATPNVTISQDGKSGGTELKTGPKPEASSEPAIVPVGAATPAPVTAPVGDVSPVTGPYGGPPGASTQIHMGESEYGSNSFRHFYFGPEVSVLNGSGVNPSSTTAYGLGVGFAFSPDVAIHGYAGRYQTTYGSDSWEVPSYNYNAVKYFGGGELVVTPFHTHGEFSTMDIGGIVGANSIRGKTDDDPQYVPGISTNVYVGALVRFNLGRSISVPVSYNIGSNASYVQAGLSVRL